MNEDSQGLELVGRIRKRFPKAAARTEEWLLERGWTPEEYSSWHWVEAFADRISDEVRARDSVAVQEQTEFISKEYRVGSDDIRRLIDVAYAENVMWDLDDTEKVWAWPYISSDVQKLYGEIWGEPEL